jgi:hypothetical protein
MKVFLTMFIAMVASLALCGQGKPPFWLDESGRAQAYPQHTFLTGFAYTDVPKGKSVPEATEQVKTEAQADLSKKIRLQVSSKSQNTIAATNAGGQYSEEESFSSQAATESKAEIVGLKTETYYDAKRKQVYALAYANKYELIGYYKGNLAVNLGQVESMVKSAQELKNNDEKTRAREQCETAWPLLLKVREAQDLLTAVDVNATQADLQTAKTEALYSTLTQLRALLAQGTYVLVESTETLFGAKVNIVANKVKSALASSGCSFTTSPGEADFTLSIKASTRPSSEQAGIAYCYADVEVELYDNNKGRAVYSDALEHKSGSNTQDKAGRKALGDIAQTITEKLSPWLK